MTGPTAGTWTYGVDVGGTKILAVAVDDDGEVVAQRRAPTPRTVAGTAAGGRAREKSVAVSVSSSAGLSEAAGHPGEAVADAVAVLVEDLDREMSEKRGPGGTAVGIGIGIAGLVDASRVLRFSPNLAAASGAHVGELVHARLGGGMTGRFASVEVGVHNDAKCAAFAELVLGAARGMCDGLVITLGTGVGGASIVDGRVRIGAHGFGGEFGHMVVDPHGPPCPCGNRGCWERYASGGGLARLAQEAAFAGTLHEAVRLAGGDPALVTGEHVTAAAAAGDEEALGVMDELGWWVGLGLANLVAAFDPEWIVLGGGLGRAGEMLLEPSRRALAALVEGGGARDPVPVLGAGLGEQAGAIGAALAARTGSFEVA